MTDMYQIRVTGRTALLLSAILAKAESVERETGQRPDLAYVNPDDIDDAVPLFYVDDIRVETRRMVAPGTAWLTRLESECAWPLLPTWMAADEDAGKGRE